MNDPIRAIAFYLPQFHPIPENDIWWGKGFTEWTNVAKARPLFPGHYQPHLPADLGFYDLRLPEVREQQADLAKEHGLHGFCYYHYWFNGRRLLNRPVDEVIASGKPDFPFCLCWANESWRRNWDGLSGDVLVEQTHDPDDDIRHIRWLCKAFSDPRYIRVEGKPLVLIYRATIIDHVREMLDTWRAEASRQGFDGLYLCRVESFRQDRQDCRDLGFDAAVEFQPDFEITAHIRTRLEPRVSIFKALKRSLLKSNITDELSSPFLVRYEDLIKASLNKTSPNYVRHPCVTPQWDNTARKGLNGLVLTGSTPELFRNWLGETVKHLEPKKTPRLVFINAWNEWAEGCHLEPCARWGRGYLEACRDVLIGGL
jgi:lipopolysaccharide biosynthesis protein